MLVESAAPSPSESPARALDTPPEALRKKSLAAKAESDECEKSASALAQMEQAHRPSRIHCHRFFTHPRFVNHRRLREEVIVHA
jgi:hypothetical protein